MTEEQEAIKKRVLAYIRDLEIEAEAAKTYGDIWRITDYKARRSMKAGEICNLHAEIARLTAKAERHPKSIGGRKARGRIKQARREIRQRQQEIDLPLAKYRPKRPEYYTGPNVHYVEQISKREIRIAGNV